MYPDTLHDEALLEMQSNTSPWTELFQDDAAAAEAQGSAAESSAAAWHSTDDERPTHDALSAIFCS
jgi:hypothetical protein